MLYSFCREKQRAMDQPGTARTHILIFVLDSGRILRYNGRIDDSRDPAKAMYSDLEHALEDVLTRRTVRVPETKPFGCAIVR